MNPPDKIATLVKRFHDNRDAYKSGKYNETQVRREFIDPLFEELGWDVSNNNGYAEAYKDVVHEDAIRIGGATKAPDYCFRIGGIRKFFLEAKNPSINIREDIHPAFQLRRYAWSAKLPLSILTDFEEFAVYDCRVKPVKTDKASHSRVIYLTYDQYPDRWDEIADIFSRQAILKGSFDRFATSKKKKRGTAEVDNEFLKEIERWRELLARNFALRNPGLSQQELNLAVQLTIDRIIFLRICEDRGVETYGSLMALQNGANTYKRLFTLFQNADDRYNSGLFHFRPEKGARDNHDTLTPGLLLDDKPLKNIFKNLYYPDSPYEFSVLGADILGQVYEQFLGKVIRLTPGHQAKIEEKPEVRKAGGVFYTPQYIVDYIVKRTIGRLVADMKPGPRGAVSKLKILDPACGSGSFLLGAYQFLLDWHLEQYSEHSEDTKKWCRGKSPVMYQDEGGDYHLTTDEKKRILTNNIFGVDIDPQAVEVTKLSLLLKVLEGENEQTITRQFSLFKQRVLPNLDRNIKCGNSLIEPDLFQYDQPETAEAEELTPINPFSWPDEFPEIMKSGGFDAVIGNPPYVRQELLGRVKPYLQKSYETYHGTADLYVYFIEKGISLLNTNGRFGIIVANKWMRAAYGKPLRNYLKNKTIGEITDFGDLPVFQSATTYPCILVIENRTGAAPQKTFQAADVKTLDFDNLGKYVDAHAYTVRKNGLAENGWSLVNEKTQDLLDKLKKRGTPLGEYVNGEIYRGVLTGLNKAFVIDQATRERLIAEDPASNDLIKPFVVGKDIKRYQPLPDRQFLILIPKGWTNRRCGGHKNPWQWFSETYPAVAAHLAPFTEKAKKRCDQGEYWWELRTCDYYEKFEEPKIVIPAIAKSVEFTFDERKVLSNNKTSIVASDDLFLLGAANSTVSGFFIQFVSSIKRGGYYDFEPRYSKQLPIPIIDFDNPEDKKLHDRIVSLVQTMLDLNRRLAGTGVPHLKKTLKRQIETTDRQINTLVYRLYGLTRDEIGIVEKKEPPDDR